MDTFCHEIICTGLGYKQCSCRIWCHHSLRPIVPECASAGWVTNGRQRAQQSLAVHQPSVDTYVNLWYLPEVVVCTRAEGVGRPFLAAGVAHSNSGEATPTAGERAEPCFPLGLDGP